MPLYFLNAYYCELFSIIAHIISRSQNYGDVSARNTTRAPNNMQKPIIELGLGIGLGLHLVCGWLVVMRTYLYNFPCHCHTAVNIRGIR